MASKQEILDAIDNFLLDLTTPRDVSVKAAKHITGAICDLVYARETLLREPRSSVSVEIPE